MKKIYRDFAVFLFILLPYLFSHSTAAQAIFPDLNGQELLDELRATYKPSDTEVRSYNEARDLLFAYTATEYQDSLHCVYSGYTIYLDPDEDPSTDAYNKNINTEHTYPQSKGAENHPARSDMHHLFPVRENVNSSRGNDPYAEIPDSDTDSWFRNNYSTGNLPTNNIDQYSEHDDQTQTFEPREDHKGNAARAVFYFYTMYKNEADAADPSFFEIQKNILYQWHQQDQADDWEKQRNNYIASVQGGKPNPFILDPSLIQRAYFPDDTLNNNPIDSTTAYHVLQYARPNPCFGQTDLVLKFDETALLTIKLYDLYGRHITTLAEDEVCPTGEKIKTWNAAEAGLLQGMYVCVVKTVLEESDRTINDYMKIVLH